MVNAVIIDDEKKNCRILAGLIDNFISGVVIVGEADSAETGVPLIKQMQPDLVFLDIEMPFGNAFDLLDKLMPVNFEIIFITAFDNYTLKAFKYSALDYLLKPVSIDELKAAVDKAKKRIHQKSVNNKLQNLLFNLKKSNAETQKLALPDKDGLVFIALNEIVRFESKSGYTYVFTKDKKYLTSKSIREFEEILPAEVFFRTHNAHIINLNNVRKYHKGRGGTIEMSDDSRIELAIRRKDEFLARFG